MLLCFALAMFIGCYLAGMIPLAVSLSGNTLRLVSVLGAGILVGTALAVIIPEGINTLYSSHLSGPPKVELAHSSLSAQDLTSKVDPHHDHSHSSTSDAIQDAHAVIGVTLVLGFVFMLLVDQIATSLSRRQGSDVEGGNRQDKTKITATLGLVVHAATDGIALGAAATTSHTDVEMIVFIAIMLHKAPAAFGLVTFLMHEGLDRVRIRKHLLIFSLAAPLLAIAAFFGISQSAKEALSTYNATGIAMLFSAGTFLYVATVHVLPEITGRSHSHTGSDDSKGFTKLELTAIVVGALLPVFLSLGHHH